MKLARWADMNVLCPHQSLLVYKNGDGQSTCWYTSNTWSTWPLHAILISLTDVRPRCLLHNTCKLPIKTCKSIITTTAQEMGKVRLYNVYWLCRVVIDRTIVLHKLCLEDCRHRHSMNSNESDVCQRTFGVVPERCSLRVQRRVVIRFCMDDRVNPWFINNEKVYCTAK